ncbi:hypothetical protein [Paludisphaera rhizosphaerae]|uniref:hypothetical protein n=1 Tax=Paludisphaera rhizosphaerae TaxID=2711216 RepID=UPI0013ECDA68|nr:hypothetical protein [Paludisphaera rhizosphaerae]
MKALSRIASLQLSDDLLPARIGQGLCYLAAPAVLILAVRALSRSGASHAEIVIGLLAASAVSIGLTVLGTLTALVAELRRR